MDHYYSKNPKSNIIPYRFHATLLGNDIVFNTGSGVFSIKKIDRGTEVLIDNCIIKDNQRILDLACGYGPVGIALSKKYKVKILMTDVNQRAIAFARQNIKDNHAKDIETCSGNLYSKVTGKFDTILVNPPQTAGKDICLEMIRGSKDFLDENGTLQIVARHNKGGKILSKEMEKIFGNVEVLARKSGYRVYLSKNSNGYEESIS